MILEIIKRQTYIYEKVNGRKPVYLILVDFDFKDQFKKEVGLLFDSKPDEFIFGSSILGMKVIHRPMSIYGGSCKYILAGDD